MKPWLVLLDGPLTGEGEVVLRIAVGALAAGASVQVVASPSARASIDEGLLSEDADDYVRTLREGAGAWMAFADANWRSLLAEAAHVVRLGASDRSGAPALFVIDDDALAKSSEAELARSLREAGQLIRSA